MAKKDNLKSASNLVTNTASGAATGGSFAGVPGAIVGGIFGLGQSIAQNKAQREADKQQQQYSRENAAYQANRQDYLMQMEQNYNSPKHQIELLREAGLNPALIYQQLGDFTTEAPSAPLPANNTGSQRTMDVAGPSAAFGQLNLQAQQTQAATDLAIANTRKANADASKQEIDNTFEHEKVQTEINHRLQEIDKLLSDSNLTKEQLSILRQQKESLIEKAKLENEKLTQETALITEQISNVNADTFLKNAQEVNTKQDTENKKAELHYTNSLKQMIDSKTAYQEIVNQIEALNKEVREYEVPAEQQEAMANRDMWRAVQDFCEQNEDLKDKEYAVFYAMFEYYQHAGVSKARNDYDTYAKELRTPSFWLELLRTILSKKPSIEDVIPTDEKKK